MKFSCGGLLLAGLIGLLAAVDARAFLLSRTKLQVNVNVSVTEEGRGRTLPTAERPQYYLPVLAGFLERGEAVAGETAPQRKLITDHLARELAQQHYLVMGPGRDPTIILVFHWGYLYPSKVNMPEGQTMSLNRQEALVLVGGSSLSKLPSGPELDDVSRAALENRYFVIVTAYDYQAATQNKKVLLWRARMSAPSDGIMMANAVASLIKAGGPHFGRETETPVWDERKLVRNGKVELGPIQVIESEVKLPQRQPAKE